MAMWVYTPVSDTHTHTSLALAWTFGKDTSGVRRSAHHGRAGQAWISRSRGVIFKSTHS